MPESLANASGYDSINRPLAERGVIFEPTIREWRLKVTTTIVERESNFEPSLTEQFLDRSAFFEQIVGATLWVFGHQILDAGGVVYGLGDISGR